MHNEEYCEGKAEKNGDTRVKRFEIKSKQALEVQLRELK